MINVKITFYAHLRQKVGSEGINLQFPNGATVKDLRNLVMEKYPEVQHHIPNMLVMMNKTRIGLEEDLLEDNMEVSFIPPIGGG
jgi:molybdopterin converting factor small subunit